MRHPAIIAMALAVSAGTAAAAPPAAERPEARKADERKARGAALYASCVRCHGEAGDELGYPNILTLVGLGDRLSDAEIAARSGAFVGTEFRGADADVLVAHIKSLKGKGGYERPGLLVETHWLLEKHVAADRYRILDVRPLGDYRKAHIPNAVHVDISRWAEPPTADQFARAMDAAGVDDKRFVIICDGAGGPDAAYLWWLIGRFGQARVAVLNGGWEKWRTAGPSSANVPDIKPAKFTARVQAEARPAAKARLSAERWRWVDALTADKSSEFRPAGELRTLAPLAEALKADPVEVAGGNLRDACHMVFVLSLLGVRTDVVVPRP